MDLSRKLKNPEREECRADKLAHFIETEKIHPKKPISAITHLNIKKAVNAIITAFIAPFFIMNSLIFLLKREPSSVKHPPIQNTITVIVVYFRKHIIKIYLS